MAELVNKRYALSLFEAGLELDKIEDFHKELKYVNDVFHIEEKLLDVLNHPRISKDEKKDIVERLFKDNLSPELLNFLFIIIDRKREGFIYGIIDEYIQKYNDYMNIVNVLAVTAIPMGDNSKVRLTSVIEEKLNKKVQLINEVDESVLGGVMLKIDNKFIDTTIASQLKAMETAIKGVSL